MELHSTASTRAEIRCVVYFQFAPNLPGPPSLSYKVEIPSDLEFLANPLLLTLLLLGSTDVICEGYSSPDDPYILKGSCGVEYRMVLTRAGEDKWPDLAGGGGGGNILPSTDRIFPILFWVIFVSVLGYIIVSACRAVPNDPARPRAARRNNYGGGGGGDGWDDPPPPYPGTGGGGSGRGSGWGRKNNNRGTGGWGGSSGGGSNWQSNLMSGAAGAAAGYYAGSRGRNNNNTNSAAPNYGSTWGSGGGAGPSRSGSSGSSSGSAASSSRHESTGFGSTSRR